MSNLTRITITIPEDMLARLKQTANLQDESLSAYITKQLARITGYSQPRVVENPLDTLGKIQVDISKLPAKYRDEDVDKMIADLDDEHLARKMGNW